MNKKPLILVVSLFMVLVLVLTGCAGPAGTTGPAGAQGPAGEKGTTGAQGPAGDRGPAGTTGPAGVQGPVGPAGTAGATGPAGPAGTAGTGGNVTALFSTVNTSLPLWAALGGTAPRMLELAEHFNIMWFAGQAGNWDAVMFEAYRVDETVKANVIVRPARKEALESWSKPAVAAIQQAATSKNITAFVAEYDRAILGCNACHMTMGGGPLGNMSAHKIIRPTSPLYSNINLNP
ncbi:MAG: hypothetical protein Q7R50_04215 [Dehalococcoidales bacterium]|nr:hypothetical protein [Dehalococcoidales bacterium]